MYNLVKKKQYTVELTYLNNQAHVTPFIVAARSKLVIVWRLFGTKQRLHCLYLQVEPGVYVLFPNLVQR